MQEKLDKYQFYEPEVKFERDLFSEKEIKRILTSCLQR